MRQAAVTVAVVGLLAGLLWIAAELHYRNCVEAAKAYPDIRGSVARELDEFKGTDPAKAALAVRLDRCSRWPF